jgi:predicted component of type VI protein secretion system
MHRLRVYRDGLPAREVCVAGRLTIGRDPHHAVALLEGDVSVEHARVELRDGGCVLTDLGSLNGTLVDGARLPAHEPWTLAGGERIDIGRFRLEYLPEVHVLETVPDEEHDLLPALGRRAHGRAVHVLAVVALVLCLAVLAVVVVKRLAV